MPGHRSTPVDLPLNVLQSGSCDNHAAQSPAEPTPPTSHQPRCRVGYDQRAGPLAQLAEQRTFNPWVLGSIPRRPTM